MKRERLRRMKPYHPRHRRTVQAINKQMLTDIERKISADLGDYIVLIQEGSKEQVEIARQKAHSDFLKFAPDMKKIADKIGGIFAKDVEAYLNSINDIINSPSGWVDESLISHCFKTTNKLENDLKLSA